MDEIKQAIKTMCQSVSGGYAAMAAALGMSSRAALENRIYEVKGQRVSIEEAMMMQRMADRFDFAEAVAAESGGVFVLLPEGEVRCGSEEVAERFLNAMAYGGALVRKWQQATADGQVCAAELEALAKIERRIIGELLAIRVLTEKYYTAEE